MTWVRRAAQSTPHNCQLPMHSFGPDGSRGDLYRCDDCGTLWRIGLACTQCDKAGIEYQHGGQHPIGKRWRTATLWQRIRYAFADLER